MNAIPIDFLIIILSLLSAANIFFIKGLVKKIDSIANIKTDITLLQSKSIDAKKKIDTLEIKYDDVKNNIHSIKNEMVRISYKFEKMKD